MKDLYVLSCTCQATQYYHSVFIFHQFKYLASMRNRHIDFIALPLSSPLPHLSSDLHSY
jgi:hypothetical protein